MKKSTSNKDTSIRIFLVTSVLSKSNYFCSMDSLVKESNGDVLDINSLPHEVILKIFDYLKQNQLGQIARVCRRWDMLTRSPVLWKKVSVEIFPSQRSLTAVTESFINGLTSCVTSIRFDFNYYDSSETLDFVKFCVRLQEKCPHLEVLILFNSELSCSFSSVMDLCFKFLQDVKKLVFRFCEFSDSRLTGEWDGISKLEILNVVFGEYETVFREPLDKPPFSRMPYLKELHVSGTPIGDSWFDDDTSFLNQLHVLDVGCTDVSSRTLSAIKNHGRNLKMLCLNWINGLEDDDLNFNHSVLSQLETICLRDCGEVTCEIVVSLIQSCQSLQNVYVDKNVAESFVEHPFVVANRCKSGIVKVIDCNHDEVLY